MEVASRPNGSHSPGYIRGAGGVVVDGRRVFRLLALILVLGLMALSVVLAVTTSRHHSRLSALRSHGVTVPVKVTRCLGISSGVGMSIEYWQCRGSFMEDGQTFEKVIGGSRTLLERGQIVEGRVVPGQPASLYLSSALPPPENGAGPYAASLVSGVAAVVFAAAFASIELRKRRRSVRGHQHGLS